MRKIYGYARVSTKEQNLDRQILALQKFGIDDRDIIRDKASGKTLDREGYKLVRNHLLREGDSLVIMSLDRLSRNKLHIKQELEYFKKRRIRVMILDMPTTLTEVPEGQEWIIDMINNILIGVLSSIAEQERVHTLQRQAQGIEAAKQKGKHLGRPKITVPANWEEVYSLWIRNEITAAEAMKRTGLKRSSFYKLAAIFNDN
ncbi:MAG: recombinase family protein [Lachnospiraceae bacterium]|nr:recombinase family protein [Lachnospiraceae bacterium]